MMVETTERVLQFAREAFVRSVQELLDDPAGVLELPANKSQAKAHMAEQRLLAKELGYDFDAMLNNYGSAFEVRRLRKLEAGQ
jgi:hypothetical protein